MIANVIVLLIVPETNSDKIPYSACDPTAVQSQMTLGVRLSPYRLPPPDRRVRSAITKTIISENLSRGENSRYRSVVSAIFERGATFATLKKPHRGQKLSSAVCPRASQAMQAGSASQQGGRSERAPLLKQQSRRGGHRDGFALSPIRAIFSDGIRWVVETGSEVVRLSSLAPCAGSLPARSGKRPSSDEWAIYRDDMRLA